MYGREYAGKEIRFEPSGGLMHASLVMQDKETDTYWSIMTGSAIAGPLAGTPLDELSGWVKTTWREWVAEHPDTLVLSVEGKEHEPVNPYVNYFESDESFRGATAVDDRLPTKAAVFAFRLDGRAYATPHEAFEGGASFPVGERSVFVYRSPGAPVFESSVAFVGDGAGAFSRKDGAWTGPGGSRFDRETLVFEPGAGVDRLDGFDTFWFNWSMTHPSTGLLR